VHRGLLCFYCYSTRRVSHHVASLSHLKPHLLGSLVSFSFFSIFSLSLSHAFAFLHDKKVMSYHSTLIACMVTHSHAWWSGMHDWRNGNTSACLAVTSSMQNACASPKASQMMHRWCANAVQHRRQASLHTCTLELMHACAYTRKSHIQS